uniref:Uncharacterized protein n=1 Tax=Anguilla anguilla TaxID=7936 RepID=A0A0E9UG20_ANGAN
MYWLRKQASSSVCHAVFGHPSGVLYYDR